jgi:hypothetical protein
MAVPSIPTQFYVQQGNAQVYLSWALVPGALGYQIQRSTDGVNFATLATPTTNSYLDTSVTVNTLYYYQLASSNVSGLSGYTASQPIIPNNIGQMNLGQLRLQAQQRADRVGSNFLTLPEWNENITNSYKELYDLIAQKFGDDYFIAFPYTYTTSGTIDPNYQAQVFPLPINFYKLILCEVALNPQDPNSWVTLKQYQRIQQNLWNFPNVYTFYGITNLRYRLTGTQLQIVPIASAGQTIRIWYIPRPNTLMQDTDLVDGISGWEEYIIIDAAIKALQKEESDIQVLALQKAAIIQRLESAAANRNVAEPQLVSDSKRRNFAWGDPGDGFGYGDSGSW